MQLSADEEGLLTAIVVSFAENQLSTVDRGSDVSSLTASMLRTFQRAVNQSIAQWSNDHRTLHPDDHPSLLREDYPPLPPEALASCFRYLPVQDVMRAAHVSREWRRVALDNGSFWTFIRVTSVGRLPYLRHMLALSKDCPVEISTQGYRPSGPESEEMTAMLVGNAHRIRSLHWITESTHETAFLLEQPMPQLVSFLGGSDTIWPDNIFHGIAPKLEVLDCSNFTRLPTSSVFRGLRAFRGGVLGSSVSFAELFRILPRLEELVLRGLTAQHQLPTLPAPLGLKQVELYATYDNPLDFSTLIAGLPIGASKVIIGADTAPYTCLENLLSRLGTIRQIDQGQCFIFRDDSGKERGVDSLWNIDLRRVALMTRDGPFRSLQSLTFSFEWVRSPGVIDALNSLLPECLTHINFLWDASRYHGMSFWWPESKFNVPGLRRVTWQWFRSSEDLRHIHAFVTNALVRPSSTQRLDELEITCCYMNVPSDLSELRSLARNIVVTRQFPDGSIDRMYRYREALEEQRPSDTNPSLSPSAGERNEMIY